MNYKSPWVQMNWFTLKSTWKHFLTCRLFQSYKQYIKIAASLQLQLRASFEAFAVVSATFEMAYDDKKYDLHEYTICFMSYFMVADVDKQCSCGGGYTFR